MHHITATKHRSVLANLRSVTPSRTLDINEALRLAELQASKLLQWWNVHEGHVPSEIVTELPRVRVVYEDLPVSGTSHWNGTHWIITLNAHESRTRQRFTLMHEFKHIIDHGQTDRLYPGDRKRTPSEQAELAADYFAGCVLLPKRLLKRAWGDGIQRPVALARHFRVSMAAVEVRLAQTGLSLVRDRCARPIHSLRGRLTVRPAPTRWRPT